MVRRMRLLLVLLFGLCLLVLSAAPPADAFKVNVHAKILKDALGDKVSEEALDWVDGYYIALAGSGGSLSDTLPGQFFPHLHFDSAQNPTAICERWQGGVAAPMERGVEAVLRLAQSERYEFLNQAGVERPGAAEALRVRRKVAMEHFGTVTHAVADFYAHTNWVELQIARFGDPPRTTGVPRLETAPIAGSDCRPGNFPNELQSGYASMAWYVARGGIGALGGGAIGSLVPLPGATIVGAGVWGAAAVGWCNPVTGPPAGFKWCHDDLAKDENLGYGGENPDSARRALFGGTLHELAVGLATRSTADAFEEWHRQTVAAIQSDPDSKGIDAECIWRKVTKGGSENCVVCDPLSGPTGAAPQRSLSAGESLEKQAPQIAGTYRGGFTETELDTGGSNTNQYVSGYFEAWRLEIGTGPARLTENKIELNVDGTGKITGGSMTLQVEALRSGRTVRGRFDGRVRTDAFTTLQNPTTLFGTVQFQGRVTTEGSGRDRNTNDSLDFNYAIDRVSGNLFLCTKEFSEATRCMGLRLAILSSGAGPAVSCSAPSVAPPAALEPRTWSGTFNSSFGQLQLRAVPGSTGSQIALQSALTEALAKANATPASDPNQPIAAYDLIVGTYDSGRSALVGWASGDRLRGVWFRGPTYEPPDDSGDFELVLADDGRSFKGRSNDAGTGTWRSDWTGSRTSASSTPPAVTTAPSSPVAPSIPAPSSPPSVTTPGAAPTPGSAAAAAGVRIRIEPNQGSYQVGQSIRICYTVPGAGQVTITDRLPNGSSRLVVSVNDDGNGDCFTATITEPLGRECVRIDFSNSQGSSWHEVCFEVVRSATAAAPPPSAATSSAATGQVRLTLDPSRATYRVGDRLRVCYSVPAPGQVTLTDIRPDGSRVVLLSGMDDGRGGCLSGEIAPPTGRECIRIDFRDTRGTSFDEVCFTVQN